MRKNKRLFSLLIATLLLISSFNYASAAQETIQASAEEVVRVREVESLRTSNSETYLLSDGTYQCVIYSSDKYYETADGKLQQIDNSIVLTGNSVNTSSFNATINNSYKNAGNRFGVSFSGQGKPKIDLTYKDYGIAFTPVSASSQIGVDLTAKMSNISVGQVQLNALSQLTETGSNTARYSDVFPSTDLVYVLEDNALKEYIIINDAAAPNSFTFRYELDGVTVNTDNKNPQFSDGNNIIFTLMDLFAIDANGVTTDALSYTVTPTLDGSDVLITVTLDESFLSSQERTYPIIIDPSTVVLSSSQTSDTCVCSYHPKTNYYLDSLRTGFDGEDTGVRRSYIQFAIPNSLMGADVTTAILELKKVSGASPTVYAYPSNSLWTSSTLNWNNKPGYNSSYKSTKSTVQSDGAWYSMYVTNIVDAWLNGTILYYGFVVKSGIENDPNLWTTFYSSDATAANRPVLTINYN